MRRINILFLCIPLMIYGLYLIYTGLNQGTASFYGVAENQETQINLEHACHVNRIHVTEGAFVSKGTLLMEVTRAALEFRLSALSHDITELVARDRLNRDELRGRLDHYRALRAEKAGDIQARIRILEAEQTLNQNLFLDLKSLPGTDTAKSNAIYATKLQGLKEELRLALDPIDVEIARLEKEIKVTGIPAQTELSKLKKEIDLYQAEQEQLKLFAPADGLVGSIHCREGENIQSFNTLISFYEQSPNTVLAFLHESLSTQLRVGDSIIVSSTQHPEQQSTGTVSGLGHRIVEIPERLRKISEIKSYGREVLIRIPANNQFLQKEKVMLQYIGGTR